MRKYLKILIVIILLFILFIITIIPKLLSYIWYRRWYLSYTNSEYVDSIIDVVSTIVECEQ